MWPFTASPGLSTAPTLDQEFIARYWDLEGRVIALESNIDERLHELEKRYKRAEQAERRLNGKKPPCEDEENEHDVGAHHLALKALKERQNRASSPRIDIAAG